MEPHDFFSFLPPSLRVHIAPIILGTLGIVLIGVGLAPLLLPKQKEQDLVFEQGSEHEASVAGETTSLMPEQLIKIDVAGAVARPGVYSLSAESRLEEAIKAAGGFTKQADNEWIAKNLNLASKLHDEEKLYVPFEGEVTATHNVDGQGGIGLVGQESQGGGLNINTASQSQLEALPGIGPATAVKIISGRPYSSTDELASKKIVGASVFEKIKEKITTN